MHSTEKPKKTFASDRIILYTVKDIQEIFHIGRTKAYNMMNSSTFPSIWVGNRLYVDKKDLEEWLKSNIKRCSGKGNVYKTSTELDFKRQNH